MNCWRCGGDVIWGGDHDDETDDVEHLIVSNLHCSECNAFYLMYWGERDEEGCD